MYNEEKYHSYISSNTAPVKIPNNNNIDNNNNNNVQTLLGNSDTQSNANTNALDVNETIGLLISTRVRKPPSYMSYEWNETGLKAYYPVVLMMSPLTILNRIMTLLGK